MDRLNLQTGFVISKHDYNFLQNSIEEGLKRVLSAASDAISFSQSGAVVIGFDLLVNSPTEVRLYNNNSINLGYAVNKDGKVIKYQPSTSSGIVINFTNTNIYNNLAPQTNTTYVCAIRLIVKQATEDPDTGNLDFTTPGRISLITTVPGNSGGLFHDRLIEDFEFKFIPLSIFSSLTNNEWIELGRFTTASLVAQISGTTINTNNVNYLTAVIRPNSIGMDKLTVQIKELLEKLFVVLDYPSYARQEYSGVLNKYLFTDKRRPLYLRDGSRELYYWEAELGTQEPVAIYQPDIVLGGRLIKKNESGNSIISVTSSFSSSTSVIQSFSANASDNYNVQYPNGYNLIALSIWVNTVSFTSPNDKLEYQIVDSSDNEIYSNFVPLNSLLLNSWNTLPIITPSTNYFQWGATYKIRFRCVTGSVSLIGTNINNIRYRLFHRPPAGQFGARNDNFSICIYDKYGRIDVYSAVRKSITGIGRYIPYAADLSNMDSNISSFTNYSDPFNDPNYVNKYVAVDVKLGRFAFGEGQQPPENLEVYIYCNFYVKHSELNSVTLQRNSRSDSFKFENIESALERISKITESYLLVRKLKSFLIPVSIKHNTYKTLSKEVQYTDSLGTNLPVSFGTIPESQYKIDAFYIGKSFMNFTQPVQLASSPILAKKAKGIIKYSSSSGTFTDGHVFIINKFTYELNTSGDPNVGFGNIPITIGATDIDTLNNIVSKINTTDPEVVASLNTTSNEITIEFKEYGSYYNFRPFRKVSSSIPYLIFYNHNKTVTDPLFFTGGTLGSEIEFVPRFSNHQGLILFFRNVVYNPSTPVDLVVDLYRGKLGDKTNFVAKCTIPCTQLIPNSSFFVQFNSSNVTPNGANYSLVPGETYHYSIYKSDDLGSTIEIEKYSVFPGNEVFFEFDLSDYTNSTIQIEHNLNDLYPFVVVYDDKNEIVLPSNITVNNANKITLDLSPGNFFHNWKCVIFSGQNVTSKYDLTFGTSNLSSSGILTVNHSLNSLNVNVVVINDLNELIIPDNVRIVDNNNIEIDLSSFTPPLYPIFTSWKLRIVDFSSVSTVYPNSYPFVQYVENITTTSSGLVAITKNYDSNYVYVTVVDNNGNYIYPDSIRTKKYNFNSFVIIDISSFLPISSVPNNWKVIITVPLVGYSSSFLPNDFVKFQEIFEIANGVATLSIGFDLFDDLGSLFKSNINRESNVDNVYQVDYAGYSSSNPIFNYHWQVQDEYWEGGDNFPPFTVSSFDTVFTSSFRIFVSQWTNPSSGNPTLYWRVFNITDNVVVGQEFSAPIMSLKKSDGGNFPSTVLPASVTNDLVEVVLPTPIPPLSPSKSYRLEVKVDSPTTTLYIATDGNSNATQRKLWYKRYYSASFTALPLNLESPHWENLELPTPYYVAVDVTKGRYKFHKDAPLVLNNYYSVACDFYFKVPLAQLNSESILRPDGDSIEDTLIKYRNYILSGRFYGWSYHRINGNGTPQYPEFIQYRRGNEIVRIKFTYNSNKNIIKREYFISINNGITFGLVATENLVYDVYLGNEYLLSTSWVLHV